MKSDLKYKRRDLELTRQWVLSEPYTFISLGNKEEDTEHYAALKDTLEEYNDLLTEIETMSEGSKRIVSERKRQVTQEDWSPEHDDDEEHARGQLARAAATYLIMSTIYDSRGFWKVELYKLIGRLWPWSTDGFKPKNPIRDIERAGALCAAEIDRLLRKESSGP